MTNCLNDMDTAIVTIDEGLKALPNVSSAAYDAVNVIKENYATYREGYVRCI